MITTGIPMAQAWEKSSASDHRAGQLILAALRKGSALAQALGRFGMVTPAQQIFLMAADDAGRLDSALLRLAADNGRRAARRRQLKSKWVLLYCLLIVGWVTGSITAGLDAPERLSSILFINSSKCLIVYFLIQAIAKASLRDGWWWLGLAWQFGGRDRKTFQWSFTTHWLDLLGWQLAAGTDAATALRAMQGLIAAPAYRTATASAVIAVKKGESLSKALTDSGLLPNAELKSVLVAAEASGKIPQSLAQQTALAEEYLNLQVDKIMLWLPKVLYALIAGVALSMVF